MLGVWVLGQLVVAIMCLLTSTIEGVRIERQQLDLTPIMASGKETPCTTRNNQQGVCVHESACNEEHTIIPGGIVDWSDFREKKPCPLQGYWCCTSGEILPPQVAASESDKCLALESDVCPWCVLLYKNRDVRPTAEGPFCLGALIGSRVIITSATCLMSAQHKLLYAQVPNSAEPGKNFTVTRRQFHPNYNTGSHEYDIGIVVIENDVAFDSGKSRGACVDFQTSLEGNCVSYGFDSEGQIQSTIMTIKKKSCGKAGNSKDAACGMNSDEVCIVSEGAPVVCPKNNRDMRLVGISRGVCNDDNQVTLGDISHSKKWIEEVLESMNVSQDLYS